MRTLGTLRLTVAAVAGVVIVGGGTVAVLALRDDPPKPITPSLPAVSSAVPAVPTTSVPVTAVPAVATTLAVSVTSTSAPTAPVTATASTIGAGSTTSIRVILTPG